MGFEDQENGSGFLQLTNQRANKTTKSKSKSMYIVDQGMGDGRTKFRDTMDLQIQQLGLMMGLKMEVGFGTILDNWTLGLKPCEISSSSP
ncbi:hypothetical protein AMTRI_Chr11g95330 [Amborella trichopoda]